jgi:hypothetical protein
VLRPLLTSLLLITTLAAPACRNNGAAPSALPRASARSDAAPSASAPSALAPAAANSAAPAAALNLNDARIWVARAQGLVELDGHGRELRVISPGPLQHPVRLPRGEVVGLETASWPADLRTSVPVVRIDPHTGARARIATLPAFHCSSAFPNLAVQTPEAVRLNQQGTKLCVSFQDRNDNMVSVRLSAELDVTTGKLERLLTTGAERCPGSGVPAGEDSHACIFPLPTPSAAGRYTLTDQAQITARDGSRSLGYLPSFQVESVSPSGRWLLLSGQADGGDYVWRKLLVLSTESGQVYALPKAGTPWGAPLRPAPSPHEELIISEDSVPGEADVRWILNSTTPDALLISSTLFPAPLIPGFATHGAVVRSTNTPRE